jgi:Zn-dependent oligopeptidase
MLLLEKKRIKKITLEVIEDENLQYGLSVLLFIEVSLCDMQLHYQKQRRRGGSIKSL